MLKWLAQKNHPDLFTYSIESEITDYYKKHYAYELSDDEVNFILNPAAAAAGNYRPDSSLPVNLFCRRPFRYVGGGCHASRVQKRRDQFDAEYYGARRSQGVYRHF
jgi:hypothetical protein